MQHRRCQKKIKVGRHVGLDFYDLLIEVKSPAYDNLQGKIQ